MEFFELIDSGDGRRLERYGEYLLDRPDPQIIWKKSLTLPEWDKCDAYFKRITEDKGEWVTKTKIPKSWELEYNGVKFLAKLSPFKHTGVFPEQAPQWDCVHKKIKDENRDVNVLNLFAYTGIASLFAAKAGAKVTHVDSSKPAITWANENRALNGMSDSPIRWIIDDAIKFTSREIKRGVKYDAIIMDPPSFGHGPSGELWKIEEQFSELLDLCKKVLSPNPLFILISGYASGYSPVTYANSLSDLTKDLGGIITCGELAIKESETERLLPCGIFVRWEK